MADKIKILVVEDSMVFRELLVTNLNKTADMEVVAVAKDPYEARDMILKHHPDVMTLDIELPRMDGLEFIRKLIPQYPIPVIVISALSDKVFDVLNAGAVDFVSKPTYTDSAKLAEFIREDLPYKIRIAAAARMSEVRRMAVAGPEKEPAVDKDKIIAIGASTGGTEATKELLLGLDKDVPGIVITQHMPEGFTAMYAERLNSLCKVTVKEAKSGDIVKPGCAYIAPGGDKHMTVVRMNQEYQIAIKAGEKVNGHRPSVDVLFDSVAKAAGKNAIGVILTGMGGDGAKGLLNMRRCGARTIGQDETTCVVYGMPRVAYELGAVEYQEKLSNIAKKIYYILKSK